ncbi:MAG: hypothetical protein KJ964_10260 [Verrucomicrobia bacterium]|nr:hypothetical protein [Verrucomicrobiota bacterium]
MLFYSGLAFNHLLWQALAMLIAWLSTLLRQEALWLATRRNGVLGFAGFRKDAQRLVAGCFIVLLMFSAYCPGMAQPVRLTLAISQSKVLVEFFYTTGCDECREIEDEVLPQLQELMGTSIDLRKYDILNPTNYLHLATLHAKSGVHTTERVSIYVDERIHMGGLKTIKAKLIPTVEAASLQKTVISSQRSEVRGPQSEISLQPTAYGLKPIAPGESVLRKRLGTMTMATVAVAGLIDGLNPCAFATLIFFITLLAVAGKRGGEILVVGIGFCTAVFLTYFLLGFGVFHVIQKLTAFHRAGEALRWVMVAVLAVLCMLSFKDALAFGKTGQARAVILQLPGTIRKRIHGIMRSRLTAHRLFLGSFTIGCLVTLLESICTGQFYVPTLVYLSSQAAVGRQALGLLTIYNVMFVIPHVVVFAAAYRGITNERLLAWSRANAVWSKVLLGLGFAALAGLMVWL